MQDISKNSDEDNKALKEMHEQFYSFKEVVKPYEGISLNSGRTIKDIAKRYYQENLVLSAILEAFVHKEKYCFSDLNKWVFNDVDNKFKWDLSVSYYNLCVAKLCNIGLLKAEFHDEHDCNSFFSITEQGRDALRQQTFANLAQSSLFNYQASSLNKQIKRITIASVVVALATLAVAFMTLLK